MQQRPKEPFAGPKAVLAYLSRYTHRIAISNSRLIRADANQVTFRVKDYRINGPKRHTTMTLATPEFIRRFLIHVLPRGQHRIRHYGFFGNGNRAANIAAIREQLRVKVLKLDHAESTDDQPRTLAIPCHPLPVLRWAAHHYRRLRSTTAAPSTTCQSEVRRMKIMCETLPIALSASRHIGARPGRLAQIWQGMAQQLPEPSERTVSRRQSCETRGQSQHNGPANACFSTSPKHQRSSNPHRHS